MVFKVWAPDAAAAQRLHEEADVWGRDLEEGALIALLEPRQIQRMERQGYRLEVDLERTVDLFTPLKALPGQKAGIPGFPCYRTVEETFADLRRLADEHPRVARWIDIGDSWEKLNGPGPGYDIWALVLTDRQSDKPKAPLLIDSSIHAREYTTAELTTRFAEDLIRRYDEGDPDVRWLLENVEIHLIPVLNPDGRKRAETGLLWRKNVNNAYCSGQNLRGVDLNRNSPFFFGDNGSSGAECSEIFRGPAHTSEPETQALAAYMAQVFDDQRSDGLNDPAPEDAQGIYISVHSFSELVLPPWAGSGAAPANIDGLNALGRKMAFFNRYRVDRTALGRAAGTTVDRAYGEYGVASYTFELGRNFFESCDFFETDVFPGNLPTLYYAAKAARAPYLLSKGPDVVEVAVSPTIVAGGEPVRVTALGDDGRVFGGGGEEVEPLRAVAYTVDSLPWEVRIARRLRPEDGSYDEVQERAAGTLDTSGLTAGKHTLYLFAIDREGNPGPPTAVEIELTSDGPGSGGPTNPRRPADIGGAVDRERDGLPRGGGGRPRLPRN